MADQIAPTPVVAPNGAQNGTAPVTQAPATPPDVAQKLAKLEKDLELKTREAVIERRRLQGALKSEQEKAKPLGEKLSKLAEYEKERQYAKINPAAYLKSIYGENWHEIVNTVQANGGAPTADTVAAEIARMREEFDAKLSEKDKSQAEAQRKAKAAEVDTSIRNFHENTAAWFDAKKDDYPGLSGEGDARHVAGAVFRFIKDEWNRTLDETGKGVAYSAVEAADLLEEFIVAREKKKFGNEKWKEKLKDVLTPAKTPVTVAGAAPQLRPDEKLQSSKLKTLNNDLTGSTQGRQSTARSAEDRRTAAIAAYNAARKST